MYFLYVFCLLSFYVGINGGWVNPIGKINVIIIRLGVSNEVDRLKK